MWGLTKSAMCLRALLYQTLNPASVLVVENLDEMTQLRAFLKDKILIPVYYFSQVMCVCDRIGYHNSVSCTLPSLPGYENCDIEVQNCIL